MTLPEFFGCTFIAFGPPFALFVFTIANDPVRIIILIAAAFFWLLSLLLSSLLWFAMIPLRDVLAFGVFFSVLFQECFRYIIYRILRSTEQGLHAVAEDTRVTDNKHILAYVSGLGFGIISGMFALVNVLADMVRNINYKIGFPYVYVREFVLSLHLLNLSFYRVGLELWVSKVVQKFFLSPRPLKLFPLFCCTPSGV